MKGVYYFKIYSSLLAVKICTGCGTEIYSHNKLLKTKKPFRGNGTASNDCLPYEKKVKIWFRV